MRLALFSNEKIKARVHKKAVLCLEKRDGQKIPSRIEVVH